MNILYVAPIRIFPKGHGNIATVHQYIKRMRSLGHTVNYVYINEEGLHGDDLFIAQTYVDTLDVIQNKSHPERHENGFYKFDTKYFDGLGEEIRGLCERYKTDVIICTYIFHSKLLEYVPENILKIIDTHDKMSNRHLFLKSNNIKDEFFSCTQEDEAKYLSRADIIWARRDEETEFFNTITKSKKCITVSHFDSPNFLHKKETRIKRIGFLASDNQVNYSMTKQFIEVFSKKYKKEPIDLKLIIGGNVRKFFEANKEYPLREGSDFIDLIGPVKETVDFYNTVDAVVVPIVFGTGINVKMIEAMSFGMPVISTKCGIKGVDSQNRYHNSETLEELTNRIWELASNDIDLNDLREISKQCFNTFFIQNTKNFDSCFGNWNLVQSEKDSCCGCGICAGLCPSHSIAMNVDEKGFYRAVKLASCTNCGLCDSVCPIKHPINNKKIDEAIEDPVFGNHTGVYACASRDSAVRNHASTAGFIRTFCAEYLHQFDGVITLTESGNPLKPEVSLLSSIDDILKRMAKSKYFSVEVSELARILKEKAGRFLVVGLPCQIAGLKKAQKLLKAEFFSIELFCGGVYSHKLMDKYFALHNIEPEFIDFRDKSTGWHDFSLQLVSSDETVKTLASEDFFFLCQRNKVLTQESCLSCNYCYCGCGDMQVGDFWGQKFNHTEQGINLVITRTAEARYLLESSSNIKFSTCSILDVYQSQPWFVEYYRRNRGKNCNLPAAQRSEYKQALNLRMYEELDHIDNFTDLKKRLQCLSWGASVLSNIHSKDSYLIIPSDDGCGSFGDQAMLLTLCSNILKRKPDAEIGIFLKYSTMEDGFLLSNGIDVRYHGTDGLPLLQRFVNEAKRYEHIIIMGADILDGGCGQQCSLDQFAMMKEAHRMGKTVDIVGFSFNKTQDPLIVNGIRSVSSFARLHVRDAFSFERLQALGCSNLIQVADMAFLFDEAEYEQFPSTNDLLEKLISLKKEGKRLIGVHVTASTKTGHTLFFSKLLAAFEAYKDAVFVVLPHDYRVFEEKYADIELNTILSEQLIRNSFDVVDASLGMNEANIKRIASVLDVVITSRMHLAIASLSRNVPVISFVYQDKFEGLYRFYRFNRKLMLDSQLFEAEDLSAMLGDLLSQDNALMLEECNAHIRTFSEKNFDFLEESISFSEKEGGVQ